MSDEIKTISFKVPRNFYEEIKEYADSSGVSISDVIRDSVVNRLDDVLHPSDDSSDEVTKINEALLGQLEKKDEQMDVKDEQIDRLHQLLAMKEKTTIGLMAEKKAIEDQLNSLRHRPTVWKKLKEMLVSPNAT